MAHHSDLTGSDLHEPKGQAGAAANTVYAADGAGSGAHQKITLSMLDLTSVVNPNSYTLNAVLPDVSTSSVILIPIPDASTFVSARLVLGGTIATADSSVTFVRNDGSSFGSAVTVTASASVEGTGFNFTATINTTVTGPGYIKVVTDGASTNTVPLYITVTLTKTP